MRFINIITAFAILFLGCQSTPIYDIVISNGKLIDPSTNIEGIRYIGINGDSIANISTTPLQGLETIDATNKVIAPGFIDLHTHTPTALGTHFQIKDGVTTSLELEAGAYPVHKYGGLIKGTAVNNYGASVGYLSIRTMALEDREIIALASESGMATPGRAFIHKTTPEELIKIKELLKTGLDDGGIGIGLPLDYITTAVSDEELQMIFEVASLHRAPIFVHVRRYVQGDPKGLNEFIELSKEHNVSVHICHINANAMGQIELWLDLISKGNKEGADVSIEMYPYTAGSAAIISDVFGRDWQNIFGIQHEDVQWSATGEYLTKETFDNYRKTEPRGMVTHHYQKEEWIQKALASPDCIVASDAMPLFRLSSKVVPNGIGTFSRILAKYVRDLQLITLSDAIAKMSYLPAKRLEGIAPLFKKKGRIIVGGDADILLFNPETIQDHATYDSPFESSTGMDYVMVGGTWVIKEGALMPETYPGKHLFGRK